MTEHPAPARPSEAVVRHGLPLARTPLFGRETEVVALCRLLDEVRLLTITGQGGIGKTRVAIEVAARQRRRVVFVPLAEVDRTGVAGAIFRACTAGPPAPTTPGATAFGRPAGLGATGLGATGLGATGLGTLGAPGLSGKQGPWAGLAMEFAGEPALLVLDTFEHVVGAAGVITEILAAIPDLLVLITSRTRLGLRDERAFSLAGLADGPRGPAVQMFWERCRCVSGDRHYRSSEQEAAAEICRLLAGNPLAIELAAARTALLPPTALLGQFLLPDHSRVLGLLARGPVDLPTRQLSMRATMSWSYQLLDGPQQTLFRRLGVFSGSFCLDAAEHACTGVGPDGGRLAADALLNGIATLVDLHLVEPVPAPGDRQPQVARFALHEVPRAFAVELLEMSGEARAVRGRMHDWCVDFAGHAERGIASVDEPAWLARVEDEITLIRQTLTALAEDSDAARGIGLTAGIAGYWAVRGPMVEAMQWLATFLEIDRVSGRVPEQLRGLALGWMNRFTLESGETPDLDQAREAMTDVVRFPCSPATWLCSTDHFVGQLVLSGATTESLQLIQEGLRRARTARDSYWTGVFLWRRALQECTSPHVDGWRTALPYAQEAYAVAHDSGHHRLAARSQELIGHCLMAERDWPGAYQAMQDTAAKLRETGDAPGIAGALTTLGAILVELGKPVQAARFLAQAITEARRIGYGYGEVHSAWAVTFLASRSGRGHDAALMHDALAPHLGRLERVLPRALVGDYAEGIELSRRAAGLSPAGRSLGRGWGWLRAQALELATELATTGVRTAPFGTAPAPTAPFGTAGVPAVSADTAAIETVPVGNLPAPSTQVPGQRLPAARTPRRGDLTARELQILSAIASGRTNAQIAADLFLSAKTVMHHSTNIYRKLAVGGRAEAVALAFRTGLLQAPAS